MIARDREIPLSLSSMDIIPSLREGNQKKVFVEEKRKGGDSA